MAAKRKPTTDTTVETPATELIPLPVINPDKAPTIFGHNSLAQFVDAARAAVINEVPDLSTDKGRKRIASLAASVARSKTAVDTAGRAYLKQLKEQPKVIEAELREFESAMNALRDEVRAPLNEWEAKKEAEEARLQAAIDGVVQMFTLAPESTAEIVQGAIYCLEQEPFTVEEFGHRLEEAEQKRAYGITVLTEQLTKRQQYEAEQAELLESRRRIAALEEEKRIKEAADKAVADERERVAKQQQEQRDADAQRIRDAEAAAKKAEQDRLDAERRLEDERRQSELRQQQAADQARQQAEREQADKERQQREAEERQRRDDEARAANRAHCGAVNKAALEALMQVNVSPDGQAAAFLTDVEAKAVITAIIRGQIPAVAITY